jgi:hypothetical protein
MAVFSNTTYYKSNANNLAIATSNSGVGTPTEALGAVSVTTGTITTNSGNTAVVGVGTLFTVELAVGSYLYSNASPPVYLGKVLSITDNLNLVLEAGGAYATTAGISYLRKTLADGVLIEQDILVRVPVIVVDSVTRTIPRVSYLRNPNGALVSSNTDTAYVQLGQVSTSNLPGTSPGTTVINTTIERLNVFTQATLPSGNYFPTSGDLPSYIWYKLNPYGATGSNLSVFSRFRLIVTETLPDINITTNMPYATVNNGDY